MSTLLLFGVSLLLIVGASELFTNAVEWTGFRLKLASGATGSLLAALGTALPETVVPVVALVRGGGSAESVALGSIVGAPFMLLTLGAGITGAAVMLRRDRRHIELDSSQVRRDLGTFLAGMAVMILCLVLPRPARLIAAAVLLVVYAAYVVATLRGGVPAEEMPEPLHLLRWHAHEVPHLGVVLLQLGVSIALLIAGAELVVRVLEQAAQLVHLSTLLLSLLLVPVATELPETLNSVLWIRSRDDGLAFGNVAGAAVFQVCVLGAVGMAFTSWRPGTGGAISLAVSFATGAALLLLLRDGRARGVTMLLAGAGWILYAGLVGSGVVSG